MALRLCLILLLTAWSAGAYVLGSPEGPASCLRPARDRMLILIDSSAGPKPGITTVWNWHENITLPKPVNSSGLYEYPSCKLIYPLEGWSKFEMPYIGGNGRFLLRRVLWLTDDGQIVFRPPGGKRASFQGLALYDEGRLVRHFKTEEIFKKYGDHFIVATAGPEDRDVFVCEFDDAISAWQITTQHRGPYFTDEKRLRWYWESYTWDARTGEILSSSQVDWILWAACAAGALVAGFLVLLLRRQRRRRRMSETGS